MVKIIYSWRNQVNKCIYIQTHIQTHRHTNTLNRQQTLWIIQQMKSREVYNISFMFLFVFLRINKNSIASIYFTAILHLFLLKWHYWLLTHYNDFNMNTINFFLMSPSQYMIPLKNHLHQNIFKMPINFIFCKTIGHHCLLPYNGY